MNQCNRQVKFVKVMVAGSSVKKPEKKRENTWKNLSSGGGT
jgi:hypothetical protein